VSRVQTPLAAAQDVVIYAHENSVTSFQIQVHVNLLWNFNTIFRRLDGDFFPLDGRQFNPS
jgi:hypothetical protein